MQRRRHLVMAIGAAAAIAGVTSAPLRAAASEGSGDGVLIPPPPIVYPGTVELRWTVRVPLLTIEQREFAFRAPAAITRPQRWDYEGPAVRTERRKIGTYPEFSCKYIDWTVSNECRTVWRGIYADLPVVVVRPQHADFDVPGWRWETRTLPLAVPRWTWKEERWTVSVPVLVAGPTDNDGPARERSQLEAKQAAALATIDRGVRALDEAIATTRARDADPRRLEKEDGSALDLVATRAELRDARAEAVERFGRMRAQFDAAMQAPR